MSDPFRGHLFRLWSAGSAGTWTRLVTACVLAGGTVLFAAITWQDYRDTLERGWIRTELAARVLEEQADRALDAARMVIDRMAEAAELHGLDWFDRPGWHQMRHYAEISGVDSLWVLDAEGRVVATSTARDPPAADFPERDDLPALRSGRMQQVVRPMERGRISGLWSFTYIRPLFVGGEFRGVAEATIRAERFQDVFDDLNLPAGARLSLYRTDTAELVMHWPVLEPEGMLLADPAAGREPLARAASGRVLSDRPDGVTRLYAWHRLTDWPVAALAANPRAHALMPFWQRFERNAALFVVASFVMLMLARAILAAIRREEVQKAESERLLDELQRATALLRGVSENTPDCIYVKDRDSRMLFANPAMIEVLGKDVPALIGRPVEEVIRDPGQAEAQVRNDRRVMDSGQPMRVEETLTGRHGTRIYLSTKAPLRDRKGQVVGLVGVSSDITERKHAEEQVRSGARFTRRVLDNLHTFVGVLDLDARLIEVNHAPLEAGGLTAGDVIGRKFWDCYWWSYSREVQDQLKDAVERARNGEVVRYDVMIRIADDMRMWIDFQLAPLRDDDGRITHLIPSGLDLTPRHVAEQALRESELRLRREQQMLTALIENAPIGISIVEGPDGERSLLNQAGRRMSGMQEASLAERYGKAGAIHPDGTPYGQEEYPTVRALRHGEEILGEEMIFQKDGERRRWLVNSTPLRGGEDEVTAAITVFWDVEELRRSEENQRMLMAELDHRVKNILAVVQSVARQSLRGVGDAAERFVGRLAALARTHEMLAEGRWIGASLHRLARETVAPYLEEGTARVSLHGPDLQLTPKAAQTLTLVFHELSTNAAKHGALSVEGGHVALSWGVQSGGGPDSGARLVLQWRESGGPLVATPPRHQGFGSTLIERSVAYELDGEVELDYRRGGLVATIGMPLSSLAQAVTMPVSPESDVVGGDGAAAVGNAPLAGKRILVVEDQHLVAEEIAESLRSAGCTVLGPVATLDRAHRMAERDEVDAAVLDINLNGEMVWPVAESLLSRRVPFLFATGYAETVEPPAESARQAPRIGKPIDPGRLVSAVSALLVTAAS